jgi:LPXTG-motif cell wall-anchored protein
MASIRPARTLAATAVIAALAVSPAIGAAPAWAAPSPSLLISEIVPDTTGYDDYEFFEVTNTSTAALDLDAAGLRFQYSYGSGTAVDLVAETGTVIPAGASTVFWLSYATTTVDSFARTEADFRAAFPSGAANYDIVRVTGQAGMANGGDRGIRAVDASGAEIAESFYLTGQVGANIAAHYGVPASGTDAEYRKSATPTPGSVDPSVLAPTQPEEPQNPTDPTEPTDPGTETPSAGVAERWPLVVTEIQPDNTGADLYEYFEVANTTSKPIAIGGTGFRFNYSYANSEDRTQDLPLVVPANTVIPANGVTVFWLNYGSSVALTDAQFRAFYGTTGAYDLVRVTGPNGFANGGNRGVRVIDPTDTTVGWSYYATGSYGSGTGNDYEVPDARDARAMPVHTQFAPPTPGTIDPVVLQSSLTRPSDPDLKTASLQVTELMVNSNNVGSSDAYEYIEVYNATDKPLQWSDYTIRYLYPLADLTNSSTALWPSVPRDAEIQPGQTIVLWIKNGLNDAFTAAQFNTEFGTDLTLGEDLLEIYSGGMANGSARGIEIITNTEISQNRAYYNLAGAADVKANLGINYASSTDNQNLQVISSVGAPTPGSVSDSQVPAALKALPADTAAPIVDNRTPATFVPGEALDFVAAVSDDTEVRTVSLELSNDVDGDMLTRNLVPGADGLYRVSIAAVDTAGKSSFGYRITASDGSKLADTGELNVASTVTTDPVRLNLADGQYVSGTVQVSAAGDVSPPTLGVTVDGATFRAQPELERSPVFAFEATATDAYFRNGVRMVENGEAGDILTVFDEGYYGDVVTVPSDIPLDSFAPGQSFAVRVYAGTKAAPEIDLNENNDNFSVRNLRLILPDGRTLRPAEGYNPDVYLPVGDSGSSKDYYQATFTVPDDAFTALAGPWDTTKVADGEHNVTATSPEGTAVADVTVDNTAPVISTEMEARLYQGEFTIDADAIDSGAGLAAEGLTATLDGEEIDLPYSTSSLQLEAAEHVVVFTAADALGNIATREVRFTTPVEEPGNELLSPADGYETDEKSVELEARAVDPSGDRLDVTFGRGYELTPGAGVEASSGAATDSLDTARSDAVLLNQEQVEQLGVKDDSSFAAESGSKLPYQLFRVKVPASADDATVRLHWDGSANAGAKVLLYALDPSAKEWVELDRYLTVGDAATTFSLEAFVAAADYAEGDEITVLVQHSEGFAGDDLSTRTSTVEPNHPEDVARSDYDFTLAWESDTQYYNASDDIYDRQLSIHEYLLRERSDLNLQYLMHTGDIVDQSKDPAQWLRADPTYATLDAAGLPYGVLAGNHDVDQQTNDYSDYSKWFGEARYADNPWYGGSHLDNRGHYDLITAGGIDFIMLYMGWAPGDEQIDWMNEVLAQYPERTAFLNLHEYMLTTGGLGPIPQRIYDEVVATNPNVRFVSSGHYHDAYTRLDSFDDDGDGVKERTVTQMLFDYQGLPDGGGGYLRLLHFDNASGKIMVRTYSDYLKDYNSDDPTLEPVHQSFDIPYTQAGIVPVTKTLATDAFRADVFTTDEIASFENVESGVVSSADWAPGLGSHSWYVKSADPHGAVSYSEIRSILFSEATDTPGDGEPGDGEPGDGEPGDGEPGDGEPGDGQPGDGEPSTGAPSEPSVPVSTGDLDPALEGDVTAPASARPGDPITIGVGAERAGDWVQVWLHGAPVALGGWTQVDGDGRIHAVIPGDTAPGDYRLAVQDAAGEVIGWTTIEILAPVTPAGDDGGLLGLPTTGADLALPISLAGILLLLGALAIVLRRRRSA